MKFNFLGAIAASVALSMPLTMPAQEVAQNDTLVLSLDQCITIALNENPTIKIADMEIERVDYSKKEILGQLLPNISFNGQYSRTVEKQTMYMSMGSLGGGSSDASENGSSSGKTGIQVGLDNSYSLGFSASMPIIAPQLWATLKLSDSQIMQSIETARKSRLSLINQVKSAYYSLLLAEDSYNVILENYNNALFNQEVYQKQYEAGVASEYDVLRTSVAVKNVEPELLQAEIAIKQARLQLSILMGMNATLPIKADVSLADYETTMYDNTLSISRSIENNTDLRMLDIQTDQLNNALKIQKMAWYPTLALTANYNWTSMSNGNMFKNFTWTPYSTVGVTLSFPIFQGGQRYSKIKQARIQVDEMTWQRENLERTINMQVDLAIDNIQMNVQQIASCAESVNQADKAHEIMERSFQIGAASYLDLRDSELALTRARLAYYQAIYNYLIANSNLELLLGNADIEKYSSTNE